MRAPISVIIPTLNAGPALPACLMALGEGLQEGLIRELIISDGGSTDATLQTARAAGAEIVTGPASRGGQLRRGAVRAKGDWLLFLHADTCLAPGWAAPVLAHLTTETAAAFRLRFDSRHPMARLTESWANLRSRLFDLPYGDQALLLPRALYHAAGGYPDQPLMEDVALARALKGRLTLLPATALTSADRYQRDGWLRRGAQNLTTLARYATGTPPETLAQRYTKRP
ncbi:TIGR04283 family arsenosugar biosynthesis glycosyltransferase [Marinovum sp.]|uniref:TIGR04283 family arsenosugar biosynthesis glycosyltransferase n=1 Tax=Marinovum sp. TaxID=2024839 RepID=UPI002B27B452|nr:TIGR04283 family arsenosugar biosynthesis glycosyltransferase [Marinovum sp.]